MWNNTNIDTNDGIQISHTLTRPLGHSVNGTLGTNVITPRPNTVLSVYFSFLSVAIRVIASGYADSDTLQHHNS